MSNIFKKIGLGLAALLVLCAAFFFLYVVKTPHYSLYQIHKAVQAHDTVLFERHVDLDTIYSKGLNDLISSGFKGKKNIGVDLFAAGVIKAMKPMVVSAMKDATLDSVRREKKNKQVQAPNNDGQAAQTEKESLKKQKNKIENSIPLLQKLKKLLDVSNLKIKDGSVGKVENNAAGVSVILHDEELNKDFTVNLRMEKQAGDVWQIKEITNFVDVLTEMNDAMKEAVKKAAKESVQDKKDQK
ncbi:MAG: DUF2939 domain-containing protein [Succiniclasticum sp.]